MGDNESFFTKLKASQQSPPNEISLANFSFKVQSVSATPKIIIMLELKYCQPRAYSNIISSRTIQFRQSNLWLTCNQANFPLSIFAGCPKDCFQMQGIVQLILKLLQSE